MHTKAATDKPLSGSVVSAQLLRALVRDAQRAKAYGLADVDAIEGQAWRVVTKRDLTTA